MSSSKVTEERVRRKVERDQLRTTRSTDRKLTA
jgi:hypothetical protein